MICSAVKGIFVDFFVYNKHIARMNMGHVDRKSFIKPFTWQPVANSYMLSEHVAVLGQTCLWYFGSLIRKCFSLPRAQNILMLPGLWNYY